MKVYNMVFSLGGNCSAAVQLRERNMRFFSLPFDWVYLEETKAVEFLAEDFSNRFKNLAQKENLVKYTKNKNHPICYFDTYSRFFFLIILNHGLKMMILIRFFMKLSKKEYSGFIRKLKKVIK